ncbi:hypothetical protein EVAR_103958_1 [Eumeta japonica]|uniref:Uncharacterized protein n=1 Tax=Eumeta variegata TaxID=151549 RepID=A0A4C1YC66_EUMVA|nr:hypothetical protein EVAR_103958_1 [Eumeta japonica]
MYFVRGRADVTHHELSLRAEIVQVEVNEVRSGRLGGGRLLRPCPPYFDVCPIRANLKRSARRLPNYKLDYLRLEMITVATLRTASAEWPATNLLKSPRSYLDRCSL